MGKKKTVKKSSEEIAPAQFAQRNSLILLIILLLSGIFIVFSDFILLEKLYLFKGLASDSVNDTYPNYILISDYLRSDGIPQWSFRQGMGQNIFPFSFPDPFVAFLYLLGRENLAYGIAYMEVIKIFLAGVIFYFFLKKRNLSGFVSIAGGLFYSFSSFMIIGSCWNIFSTEVVYLALLLLSFEKLYQDNNRVLFPVAVALIAVLQPFDLWLFGVFLFVYILVRHFEEHDTFRKLFPLLLKTALLAVLGVGISAFFFLSEVRAMINSPRVTGEAGYFNHLLSQSLGFESALHYITAVMRLFSSELLGASNSYGGWYNFMEAPLFYCGLINLLLVPQLFPFLDGRKRKLYGIWIAFMIMPVVLPFLRYSFWFFTGNYYRVYAFFVSFILMFFSLQALNYIYRYNKINRKILLITLAGLLLLLNYPYEFLQENPVLNTDLRNAVILFLVFYTVLLLVHNSKNIFTLQLVLLLLICTELISFAKNNVNERKALTNREYNQKTGYSDYTTDAVSFIKKNDKDFFRITKDYSSGPGIYGSLNDSKIQGFKGTGSYHSFNQPHYIKFLSGMNIIDDKQEVQTRWIVGLRNLPVLHSFANIKYFLSNGSVKRVHMNYDSVATIGNVKIYRNKYFLPLGFTYDKFISRRDFDLLSPEKKRIILYKAFVLNDSLSRQYSKDLPLLNILNEDEIYPLQEHINDINHLKKDFLEIKSFSNNHIRGTINLEEKKLLFLSIPFSEGWSAMVNGRQQQLVRANIGFTGLLLDKGNHMIELSFTSPLFYTGAFISLLSLSLYLVLLFFHFPFSVKGVFLRLREIDYVKK